MHPVDKDSTKHNKKSEHLVDYLPAEWEKCPTSTYNAPTPPPTSPTHKGHNQSSPGTDEERGNQWGSRVTFYLIVMRDADRSEQKKNDNEPQSNNCGCSCTEILTMIHNSDISHRLYSHHYRHRLCFFEIFTGMSAGTSFTARRQ